MYNKLNIEQLLVFVVVILNIVVSISFVQARKPSLNLSLPVDIISAWVHSDSFIDDVYTFNLDGISDNLRRFIEAFDHTSGYSICINAKVKNFDNNSQETSEQCTSDTSVSFLTRNAKTLQLETGDIPIAIGSKKMGIVRYYIGARAHPSFFTQYVLTSICIGLTAVIDLVLLTMLVKRRRVCPTPDGQILSDTDATCTTLQAPIESDYKERIDTTFKIANSNKRYFALNQDILAVLYKHPYSEIVYKNGTATKIKCSLTDLEKSLPLNLLRVNRSALINLTQAKEHQSLEIITREKQSTIYFNLKDRKINLKITKQYHDTLLSSLEITTEGALQ